MNALLQNLKQTMAISVLLMLFHTSMMAQQTTYIGPATGGDWFSAANWDMGVPTSGKNALIGGGNTVLIPAALNVNYEINNFGTLNVSAPIVIAASTGMIANSGTINMDAGSSLINHNIFQNYGGTTFAVGATFTNETGATFSNNGTFTIPTTLLNKGSITNNGTINATNGTIQQEGSFSNSQLLNTKMLTVAAGSTFVNEFGSSLTITGSGSTFEVLGSVTNNGVITNVSAMTVSGTFTNNVTLNNNLTLTINPGATFNNSGSGLLDNTGTVVNNGTLVNARDINNTGSFTNNSILNNNGTLDNKVGGTFLNNTTGTLNGNFGSQLINRGSFTNKNTITTNGATTNEGTFTNDASFTNDVGAVWLNKENFMNNGTINSIATLTNDKTFTNAGTLNVNSGSIFTNNLNFTNTLTGTVNNNFEIVNKPGATLTNNGRLINNIRMFLEGTSINNSLWSNIGDVTVNTGGVLTNNEVFLLIAGNILNQGTITNTKLFRADDCSTIHNKNGSINNVSGAFEYSGIFFQRGTLSGLPLSSIGGYLHTNAASAAPSLCVNKSISADVNGNVKVYATEVIGFANFDSCQTIIYRANGEARPLFACSDIGTIKNVNIAVTTRLGDSLTCVSQVTPIDVLAPTFSNCPSDIVIFTSGNSATATWTPPTAVDNCSAVNLTSNFNPGNMFNVGITGVTYTANDIYNNAQTCQFKVDVIKRPTGGTCVGDNTGPVITNCPTNINLSSNFSSVPAVWTTPTISDACLPLSYTTTAVPGTVFQLGTTTVTYTAKDGNSNTSTCQFTVSVTQNNICATDIQKPIISNCPGNVFALTSPTINGAIALWKAPNAGDNCNLASFSSNFQSGTLFPVGTTTVTYSAADASGNTNTCSFIVTVASTDPCPGDVAGPIISGCPANIVKSIASGNSSTATWTAPTASDACTPVTLNSTHVSGAVFPIGNTAVVYQASDKKGNKSTCVFVVTVVNVCDADTTKPVITGCPSNISVAQTGTTTPVSWTPPVATDNCTLISFHTSCLPGASFPLGSTIVGYTATDLRGNISACTFIVNVVGQASCTTNNSPINESTNISANSATLTWNAITNATSYDVYLGTVNPPTTKVGMDIVGTTFNTSMLLNTTPYYWYVVPKTIAGAGQGCSSSTTTFTTGIGGTSTLLNISCPINVAVTATVGATNAVANYPSPTTNTTCPVGTITTTRTAGLASGASFPIGTTQVCYSAADGCGNTKSCCFNVVVTATPSTVTLNCPATVTVTAVGTNTTATANYTAPSGTSNCPTGTVSTVRTTGLASGSAFPVGTNQVCFTATDGCNSTKSCCFNVVVNPPVATTLNITCPANVAITAAAGATTAVATYTTPTTSTTCTVGTITTTRTTGLASGAAFPIGTTQVCYSAADGCGNTNSCCFNVVVTATPSTVTLNCPATVTVTAVGTNTTATANYTAPSGTSNCPTGTVSTVRTTGLASGSAFPVGTNQVCFTATDGCNSTKSCCFNVVVNSPVVTSVNITCPANVSITAAAGATTAVATYTTPTTSTTCTVGTITTTRTTGLASGAAFPIGTTQVCYSAADGCGNTKSCCFNVVVTATPSTVTLNCPSTVTVTAVGTNTTATANYTAPSGTSNCPTGTVSTVKTTGLASGSAFPVGTNQVCFTATDGCNSTKSCCFNVVVNPPVATTLNITCPANVAVTAAAGATTAVATYTTPTTSTTCTVGTITTTRTTGLASGAAFPIGTTQVCYSAADGCGNTKSCCFNVVVTATPSTVTLNCPSTVTVTAVGTNTTATANYTAPSGTSNCPTGTVSTVRTTGLASGSAFPVGTNQVCFTATDGCNSTKSCCFNVVVNPPVATTLNITCPANVAITAAAGATTAVATYTTPTTSTTCTVGTITTTRTTGLASGAAFPIGTTQVCYSAADGCGNTKSCCINVTINSPAVTPNCDNVTVTTSINSILVNGLTAPITQIQVFNSTYVKVFSCSGNCNTPQQVIGNLPNGPYLVKVKFFNATWGTICNKDFNVIIGSTATTLNINCPSNVSVLATAGASSAIANYTNPTTNTTCTMGTVALNRTVGLASGTSFPIGTNQVCYTATDGCGNNQSCCFNVVVNSPVVTSVNITCPADIAVTATAGATTAVANYAMPTTSTTCTVGTVTTTRTAGLASGAAFPIGTTQVCYVAADGCGNTKSCCFNVTINLPTGTPNCDNVTVATSTNSILVNGLTAPITQIQVFNSTYVKVFSCSGNCNTPQQVIGNLPNGPYLVKVKFFNATWGTICNKDFNVIIGSTATTLNINCPSNVSVLATAGASSAIANYTNPTTNTTCTMGTVALNRTVGPASGTSFPIGTNQVCFTATDGCGNTQSCCFNVVVNTPAATTLSIVCPADITVNALSGTNNAVVNYTPPSTNTNCSTGNIVVNRTVGPVSGTAFPIDTTQVCFAATDGCGNTKTCCFNITVNPAQPLTNCDNVTAITSGNSLTINGLVAPISQIQVFNAAYTKVFSCSGNCNTPQQIVGNLPNGTYLVKVKLFTATWGTICSKEFNVTVSAPISSVVSLTCPPNIMTTANQGGTSANVSYSVVSSSNCTQGSVALNRTSGYASGSSFPLGTTQVCYTATDACGSSNTCCFNVTVNSPSSCAPANLVLWSLDGCNSSTNQPSATDYSEFVPTYQNNAGFTSVSATNVSRTNGPHTCILPRQDANGIAMCVGEFNTGSFVNNAPNAIKFSVTLNGTGTGKLGGLSFWNISPTQLAPINGVTSPNNYPTKFGVRILKNGVEIYKNVDFTAAHAWTFSDLNFSTLPAFTFTGAATFSFELEAYSPIGNGSTSYVWGIDDISVSGCCTNVNLQSTIESLILQAKPQGEHVALRWRSASYQATKHFAVERSDDEQLWFETARYDAHSTQDNILEYDELDTNLTKGAHKYRIAQYFQDGSHRYSNVQKVYIADPKPFSLFPNPATDKVTMELSEFQGQNVKIQIVNAIGIVVHTQEIETLSESNYQLSLNHLADGYYTMVTSSQNVIRSARLIVSRNN